MSAVDAPQADVADADDRAIELDPRVALRPERFGALAYHYGMDLVVAMFATATGLNTPDLALRFVPTLFLVLSMLSVFCFSRSWSP